MLIQATAVVFLSLAAWSNGALSRQTPLHQKQSEPRPNIVFILADDQDVHLNSLAYMPHLQKHLVDQATTFERHYCTIALCCPSRISLWTGRAAHNTNVTDVVPPYGGYPKFVSQGFNQAWLPLWLQEAGYDTYYTGKLFNAHSVTNYHSPFPSGFNGSDFLLDPYTYQYLNASFQRNQEPPVSHEGKYSTDVLAGKAYGFLEDAIAAERPFFLVIAHNAPHSNVAFQEDWESNESIKNIRTSPPISAKRHEHLFNETVVPRTPNFNPDEPSGVSWIAALPKQNQSNVDANDYFYRSRLRALQSVDEIIDGVIARLSEAQILEDTYIFYSSDNGYHIGQHRMQPGKECGFETDINVPLIVRGPGVPKGKVSHAVTSHTDLAPTFLNLAQGKLREDFDGSPINVHNHGKASLESANSNPRREHVNVEYWGFALSEGDFDKRLFWNNTYKALRLIGEDYNLYYSVWCSGEHQLYNLNIDPDQLNNLFETANHSESFFFTRTNQSSADRSYLSNHKGKSTTFHQLLSRLDALLLVLKSCRARSCTHPWKTLHPSGEIQDLHEALDPYFDDFYHIEQEKVHFTRCEKGYIIESEGPQLAKSFADVRPRGGSLWSELV